MSLSWALKNRPTINGAALSAGILSSHRSMLTLHGSPIPSRANRCHLFLMPPSPISLCPVIGVILDGLSAWDLQAYLCHSLVHHRCALFFSRPLLHVFTLCDGFLCCDACACFVCCLRTENARMCVPCLCTGTSDAQVTQCLENVPEEPLPLPSVPPSPSLVPNCSRVSVHGCMPLYTLGTRRSKPKRRVFVAPCCVHVGSTMHPPGCDVSF